VTGSGIIDSAVSCRNIDGCSISCVPAPSRTRARRRRPADFGAKTWDAPADPLADKKICVGINYPDRNAEYKDGREAPKYRTVPALSTSMSAPTCRSCCPRSRQVRLRGEVVLVIARRAATFRAKARSLSSAASRWARGQRPRLAAPRHAQRQQGKNFDSPAASGPGSSPRTRPIPENPFTDDAA